MPPACSSILARFQKIEKFPCCGKLSLGPGRRSTACKPSGPSQTPILSFGSLACIYLEKCRLFFGGILARATLLCAYVLALEVDDPTRRAHASPSSPSLSTTAPGLMLSRNLYDDHGKLYQSKYAHQNKLDLLRKSNASLGLAGSGLEGVAGFEPGVAASLTMGRPKEELRKTIDPKAFQTRTLGKGQSSLPPPKRFFYPEQLEGTSRPHVPERDECVLRGKQKEEEETKRLSAMNFVTKNAAQVIAQGSSPLALDSHGRPEFVAAGTFAAASKRASPDRGSHSSCFLMSHSGAGGGNLAAAQERREPAAQAFQDLRRQDLEQLLQGGR